MFDPLLDFDVNMKLVPHLATEWELVNDTTLVLKLRDDVTFHNGEPFNAEVVKFNVERVTTEGFQRWPFLGFLKSATVIDDYTVQIETDGIFAQFLNRMAQFYMVPMSYIQDVGNEEFNSNPIGTGPWKFVEWVKDSHVKLEANEDYWGGAPKAKYFIWRVIPDPATRVSALLAGEVDAIRNMPSDQFELVDAQPDLEAGDVEVLRTPFLFLYPDTPSGLGTPLADVKVRQAINYAINVQGIIDHLLGGRATRTATLMLSPITCYDPTIEPYEFNPDLAKALLEEAGYPDGFTTDMNVWSNGPSPKPIEMAQAIVSDLARVGITAQLTTPDVSTMLVKQYERAFPAINMWSYGGASGDPDDKFWPVYSLAATNHLLYTEEMQELIDEARSIIDIEARCTIYQRLQEIIKEEAIIVPLFGQHDIYGVRAGLEWYARPDEIVIFNNATAVRP